MPTPYQELRFSHSQIRILKRLKRLGEINRLKIENHKNDKYAFLYKYNLIEYNENHTAFKLSDKGCMCVNRRRESLIRFYLPLIISIIAIVISIIALLKP